ncbi:MAG: rotamase, partial [Micavibrio aeruginosavorus]
MKYGILTAVAVATLSIVLPPVSASAQNVMGIAAVVNDEAISMQDVNDRMKLVMVSSGLPDSAEIRTKIRPQVIDSLVEEQLKLQTAARSKLTAGDKEVEEGFKTIAQQNNIPADKFEMALKQQGVPMATLKRQIKAQLSWNNYVRDRLKNRVNVSTSDVDTRIERMKSKIGQTEYLVADIFLPLDNPKRNKEVEEFAGRMAKELQAKKAPFGPVAAQFSKAAGAEKGGTLGWVQPGQLPEEMDKVLLTLEEGQISNPIRTQDGIHVMMLQKKRTLTAEAIPPRDELTNMIGLERL